MVDRQGCPGKVIEQYSELFERFLVRFMIFVHDRLRGGLFFFRGDRDRNTMFIRPANMENVPFLQPLIARIDIRRDITPCKMAKMDMSVRVRQGRRDQDTLKFILHGEFFADALLMRALPMEDTHFFGEVRELFQRTRDTLQDSLRRNF